MTPQIKPPHSRRAGTTFSPELGGEGANAIDQRRKPCYFWGLESKGGWYRSPTAFSRGRVEVIHWRCQRFDSCEFVSIRVCGSLGHRAWLTLSDCGGAAALLAAFAFSGNRRLRILDSLHAPSFGMGLNSSVKEQFVDFCRKSSDNATKA